MGVEIEYATTVDGRPQPFAEILPALAALPGANLKDDGSRRFWWPDGLRLMADGHYAEIASPPERVSTHTAEELCDSTAWAERRLRALLMQQERRTGATMAIEPYSCHYNVGSAPFADGWAVARRVACAFGPLLALITSRPPVMGIIVRPRPGRIEIVGDLVADPGQFRAACLIVWGAVALALQEDAGSAVADLPTLPADSLVPARTRPGLRLTLPPLDAASIASLSKLLLPLSSGGRLELGEWAARCWSSLRSMVAAAFGSAETARVDGFVDFSRPTAFAGAIPAGHAEENRTVAWLTTPFAGGLTPRQVGDWRLSPRFVDWHFIVLDARNHRRRALLTLPENRFQQYVDGVLDPAVGRALDAIPDNGTRGSRIDDLAQGETMALHADVDPAALSRQLERPTAYVSARESRTGTKKKKPTEPLCTVVRDGSRIYIYVPRTLDPLQVLQTQEPPRSAAVIGYGVWAHTGAFGDSHIDHTVRGLGFDFAFVRNYRSSVDYDGTLGRNWDHAFNIRVVPDAPPGRLPVPGGWRETYRPGGGSVSGSLTYYDGTGRMTRHAFVSWEIRRIRWCDARFTAVVSTYAQNDGDSFAIERYALLPGSSPPPPLTEPIFYRVRLRGGIRYLLNCHGYIVQERDRNHNAMTFAYGQGNPKTLYRVIDRAVDTVGDRYQFGYTLAPSGMPRLTSLAELDGKRRILTFEYDQPAMDTLLTVKLVEGAAGAPELRYAYVAGGRPGLLERISYPHAPNASPECATVENRYLGGAGQEQVVRQRVGTLACGPACGGEFVIDYAAGGRVTVTDRAGIVTRNRIEAGTLRETEVDDVTSVGGQIQRIRHVYDYDRHFHLVLHEWPSGRKERFQYRNRNRRVQAGDERDKLGPGGFTHALDLARDDLLRRWSESRSGSAAFETQYRYERLFNAPTRASAPHGTVRLDYDHGRCGAPEYNGNPIRVVAPPQLLPDGSRLPVIERREYGLGGRLIMRRDPDGVTETFDLHRTGQVARHFIGGRLVASYVYDEVGNPIEHRDQRDALTTFAYDARDNLVRTTDPLFHQVAFGYDRSDRLVWRQRTVRDDTTPITGIPPSPQRLVLETFSLDAIGSVRAAAEIVTDLASGVPSARGQQWDFDGEGRLTAMRSARATAGERADATTAVAYNARGLVQERQRAGGRVVRSYYDADGNLSLVIDASGRQVTFDYDEFGRLVARTIPGGTVEHYEYDGHELWREWVEGPVEVTPADPFRRGVLRETRVRRDASGRAVVSDDLIFDPAIITTVVSVTTTTSYTGLFASTGGVGRVARTRTWYTPGGRISRVDAPGGASTRFFHRFAAQGLLDRIELPAGHSVGFTYDGPLVRRKTTSLVPEPGQIVSPAQGRLSLTEEDIHDELGRVVRRTDASGLVTELAYDSLGRVRAERTPSGLRTREYDAFGREARIEIHGAALPGGTVGSIVQTRAHDANDNPVSAVDALGRETTFAYDGNDEPERMQIPFRGTVTVTRNPDGSVARTTIGGNRSVSMSYDAAGRISQVTADEGLESTTRRFLSDGLGRPTSAIDDNGGAPGTEVAIERRYDSLGRMTAERVSAPGLGFDQTVEQTFFLDERRRRLIYPQSNPELDYRLGVDGNLTEIVRNGETLLTRVNQGPARVLEQTQKIVVDVQQPTPTAIRLDLTEARRYDDFGRLDWRSLWLNDALAPGGGLLHIASSEWLAYGPDGGIERKSVGALLGVPDATRFSRSEFQHDGAGRLVSSAQVQGDDRRTTRFQWDGANVLREIGEETVQAGTTTAKTTTVSYPQGLNTTDRLSSSPDGEDAFTFDSEGRVKRALHRPAPGSPADVVRDFEFDPFDRLRRCSVSRNGNGRTFEYLYDAFGRLTARTEAGATGASRSTLFVSHDGRPIAEYDALSRRRRTYVYDLHGQLVDYRSRETERIDAIPVAGIDGAPWFTLRRRFGLQRLPAATGSSTADRVRYYAEAIPLIIEEHRAHLFVEEPIRRFDVVNGQLRVTPVSEGIVPVTAGGRRSFGDEGGIALIGERWFDPALREFMSPNAGGPWRDPLSLGHERSYGGNSPVMRGDDGGPAVVPFIVGGLIGGVIGGVIGVGYALGRQSVQILEESRDSFDGGEIAWCAAFGAGLGVAVALLPATVAVVGGLMLVGVGAANTVWEYQAGKIGGWTVLYDAAAMALPFGRRPLKAWWLNRGSRKAFERMAALRELPAEEQLSRLPRFLFEEEAMFVVEQAARTGHPNEVAAITRPKRFGYRTIEGGPESVSVPGEWWAIAHNHPATQLIHRLPAPSDFNVSWVRGLGSWIKSQRVGVSDEPAHAQYRVVGEGDAARVRIRPDFPEDFRAMVDVWERRGLARRVGNEIEFAPREFSYAVDRAGHFIFIERNGLPFGSAIREGMYALCGYQHAYLLARFGYLPPV